MRRDYFSAFHARYVPGANPTDDAVLGLIIQCDTLAEVVDLLEKRGDQLQEIADDLRERLDKVHQDFLKSRVADAKNRVDQAVKDIGIGGRIDRLEPAHPRTS